MIPFDQFLQKHTYLTDATSEATIRWEWWPIHGQMVGLLANRLLTVLKARQISWSWMLAAYAIHGCIYRTNYTVLILSKGQDEASEFLRKCKVVWQHLPDDMTGTLSKSNSEEMVFADTGSAIKAMPSTENAGRGFTASLIIADEAAFHPYAAANYAAYKPAIDAGGQLIIVSTANGVGNFFHRMYQSGKDHLSGFVSVFFPWASRPGRDTDWYNATKAALKAAGQEHLMAQEYPDNDAEAFLVSGNPRFDVYSVQYALGECRDPLPANRLPESLARIPGLSVWKLPTPGASYCMGTDSAQGLGDGDFDCTVVLNARTLEHVATLHGRWEPDYFGELSVELGLAYNKAYWGVENAPQGHGHTVLATARRLQYPRLYWHERQEREMVDISRKHKTVWPMVGPSRTLGWPTTSSTKPGLIDDLASAIVSTELVSYDKEFWSECLTYVRDERGRTDASTGSHDDRVMAMAIARRMAGAQTMRSSTPTQNAPTRPVYAGGRR